MKVVSILFVLLLAKCTQAPKEMPYKSLYIVQKDKKYGLIDETGKIVLPIKYDGIYKFRNNGYLYFYEENKIGVIDKDGSILVNPIASEHSQIESFSEGIFTISRTMHIDGLNGPSGYSWYGYMNKNGKLIFEPQEDIRYAEDFSDGMALVGKGVRDVKYGYINTDGRNIIDFMYDQAFSFKNEIAVVRKGKEGAIINKKGNIIQTFATDRIVWVNFKTSVAVFIKDNKYGTINFLSNKIINPQFDELSICNTEKDNEYLLAFKQKGKYGYMDMFGNILAKAQFDNVYGFNNGAALVEINNKYGVIDSKGKILAMPTNKYKIIWENGIGVFQKDKLYWGAVDSTGKVIIEPDKFVQLSSFKDGLAYAEYYEQTNKGTDIIWCIIDKDKNVLYQTNKYEIKDNIGYGLFTFYNWNRKTKEMEYGLIDKTGKVLIPLTADLKLEQFSGPLAKVTIGYYSVGYIDKTGNYVWKPSK